MVKEILPGFTTIAAVGEANREAVVTIWHLCGKLGIEMRRVGHVLVIESRDAPAIAAELAKRKLDA